MTADGLITGSTGLTITGGTASLNASSNNITNINTGSSTGAVNIGNALAGIITTLSSDVISASTTKNAAGAIALQVDGGISETISIRSVQGTGATALNLVSTAGGITLNAASNTVVTNGATFGGGYGSTGVTISTAGVVQANGALTVDGGSALNGGITITEPNTFATGAMINAGFASGTTLTGSATGTILDLSTNVTNATQSVTGLAVVLPTTTAAIANTLIKGQTITGGAFTSTAAAGIRGWIGSDITLPVITQGDGSTVIASAFSATIPTVPIVTGGTMNGLSVSTAPVYASTAVGTINGISIGALGGNGAATETAINVGATWDTGLSIGDVTNEISLSSTSPTIQFATDGTTLSIKENGNTVLMDVIDAVTTATVVDINGEVQINLDGTASTSAICGSHAGGTSGDVAGVILRDCSGSPAADYAERYPVAQGVTFGDIVVPGTHMVTTQDENHGAQQIAQAVLSSEAYQGPVYGIVSNNYGDFTSAGNNVPESENPMPVALVGRVPVKVASDSEVIRIGDFLTTSGTQPGKAMKATQAGRVVGMAMANWDGSSATIMVQVINTWYQPATSLQGGSSAVLATTSSDISGVNGAFSGTVTVAEHLYGSQDMAGRVRLVSGKSKVHVKFKKAYASGVTPIVTLASRSSGASAWVSNEDSSGFDVNRSDDSSQVEFNWIAIGVNDALVTVSNGQDDVTISVNDTDGPDAPAPVVVAPAPEVVVTPAREEVTPAADPVPEASAPAMEPAPEVSAPAADPAPVVVTPAAADPAPEASAPVVQEPAPEVSAPAADPAPAVVTE